MKKKPMMITKGDLELVKNHVQSVSHLSAFNKTRLSADLREAIIVRETDLPDNVVAPNSQVKLLDMESKREYRFYLVSPAQANIRSTKVSVLAPIGLALFGHATGAVVEWEMPDGFKKYKLLSVSRSENQTLASPAMHSK